MRFAFRRAPRRSSALPLAVALTVAIAGCSATDDDAGPPAPSPSGKAAEACGKLHRELPRRVSGQVRNTPSGSASKYTASWGDPAIELRCGVRRPDVLTPGSEHYNPTAEAVEVNGVSWLLQQREDGYRFVTTEPPAHVEVTVPDAYAPEVGSLTDLAAAVRSAMPAA